MTIELSRQSFLRLATASTALFFIPRVRADDSLEELKNMLFNDPESPTAGNSNGNLTIVDFFDYNCPFCKATAPHLERIVRSDGNIRVVYKDWPILEETSISGARLALAAKYQGKYLAAHEAMMNIPGTGVTVEKMLAAIRKTDVDIDRLNQDMKINASAIDALIKRNLEQADAIGLQGTPGFLVGKFRVNQALTYEGFQHVVADAREAAAKEPNRREEHR